MKKKYTFEEVWQLAPNLSDNNLTELLCRVDDVEIYVQAKDYEIIKRGETITGAGNWTELGKLNEDIRQIKRVKQLLQPKAQPNNAIPDCLKTQKAEESKAKAVNHGLLNEDWTLTDLVKTKALAALLAEYLSDDIGLTKIIREGRNIKKRRCWKPFEEMWGYTGFSQQRNKDQIKNTENGHLVINAFK